MRPDSAGSSGTAIDVAPSVVSQVVSVVDDDRTSYHVATAQRLQAVVDVVEIDRNDVVLDQSLAGEGEDFGQVVVIAPEGPEVGLLCAHEREQGDLHALSDQTYRGERALPRKDRRSEEH